MIELAPRFHQSIKLHVRPKWSNYLGCGATYAVTMGLVGITHLLMKKTFQGMYTQAFLQFWQYQYQTPYHGIVCVFIEFVGKPSEIMFARSLESNLGCELIWGGVLVLVRSSADTWKPCFAYKSPPHLPVHVYLTFDYGRLDKMDAECMCEHNSELPSYCAVISKVILRYTSVGCSFVRDPITPSCCQNYNSETSILIFSFYI